MKPILTALLCLLLITVTFAAPGEYDKQSKKTERVKYHSDSDFDYDYEHDHDQFSGKHFNLKCHDDKTSWDIEDGNIVIIHDGWQDDEIEITSAGDLFINDDRIAVTEAQRVLLMNYYGVAREMIQKAEELGEVGAAIGVKGAALGVKAASDALAMVFSGIDTHELESEIEAEAESIENEAERLEEEAEVVEEMADDLDEIADELKDSIDELRELRWF